MLRSPPVPALQRRYGALRAGARYPDSGAGGEGCCSARTRAVLSAQSSADGHAGMTTRLGAKHSATRRCGRPIYLPEEARKTAGFR
jgi:hypothetical protein